MLLIILSGLIEVTLDKLLNLQIFWKIILLIKTDSNNYTALKPPF